MNIKIILLCSFVKLISCKEPCSVKTVPTVAPYHIITKAYTEPDKKGSEHGFYSPPKQVSLSELMAKSSGDYLPPYEVPPADYIQYPYEFNGAVPIIQIQLPDQAQKPPYPAPQQPQYQPIIVPQYHPHSFYFPPIYPTPPTDSCQDAKATLPAPEPPTTPQPLYIQGKQSKITISNKVLIQSESFQN